MKTTARELFVMVAVVSIVISHTAPVRAAEVVTDPVIPGTAGEPANAVPIWALSVRGGALRTTAGLSLPAGSGAAKYWSDSGYGYSLGLYGGRRLTEALSVEIGAEYALRAIALTTDATGTQATSRLQWPVFRVPLALQVRVLSFLSVEAGPYVEWAAGGVSGTYTAHGMSTPIKMSTSGAGLKSTAAGALAGIALALPVTRSWAIELRARYLANLTAGSSSDGTDLNLRQAQALLGVQFGF
jgi:hypothetical protein